MKLERLLIQIMFTVLLGTAAYHKLIGEIPPNWFLNKFSSSFLSAIPFGLHISFVIILFLEVIIPFLFLLSIIKKEFTSEKYTFSSIGFNLALILFIILVFGSFLVQDYENGFIDFVYFTATLFMKRIYFNSEKTNS
jgi:hypothetical protein